MTITQPEHLRQQRDSPNTKSRDAHTNLSILIIGGLGIGHCPFVAFPDLACDIPPIRALSRPVSTNPPEPWFADGLQFSCTGCGNCCTGGPGVIWISDEELTRLAAFLNKTVDEVIAKYCTRIGRKVTIKEKKPNARGEFDCIFLKILPVGSMFNGQKLPVAIRICRIYPVRPLQCRTWPFWHDTLATPEDWAAAAAKRCPGMNRGRTWTKDQITARRDATQWPKDS